MYDLRDKPVLVRAKRFLTAWKEHATGDRLSGIERADLAVEVENAERIRDQIHRMEIAVRGLKAERDQAENALNARLLRLTDGVRGHQKHGLDSNMYRALGYVTQSENRSGRPRKDRVVKLK